MSDENKNNNKKAIIIILIIGLIIGYTLGSSSITMKKAYKYIIDNPDKYMSYVSEIYEKDKEIREKCVEDIDTCPIFLTEKKYREKQYKDDLGTMENSIDKVKETILSNLSSPTYIENYMIDTVIKNTHLIGK